MDLRESAAVSREPQARFLKGLALADSGKTDAAIETFQAVLGDYPELPEPHNNLGLVLDRLGDSAGAIACWKESPSSEKTAMRRGLSALKIRQKRPQASWAADVVDGGTTPLLHEKIFDTIK